MDWQRQLATGRRTSGDGMEAAAETEVAGACLAAGSSLSVEERVLRHLVQQQQHSGRSLAQVLGDAAPNSMRHDNTTATAAGGGAAAAAGGGGTYGGEGSVKSHHTVKTGQFVPYEPYSACTVPITTSVVMPTRSGSDKTTTTAAATKITATATTTADHTTQAVTAASITTTTDSCSCSCRRPADDVEHVQLVQQLQQLTNDKQQLNQQLVLANQVCDELKRLVVLSMGEDIEWRLSLMTEERARLAQLVREYSATVAVQHDTGDRLAIQCDVLHSKYRAYSLMVQELSQWKAALSRRNQQSEHVISALLADLNIIGNSTIQSLQLCRRISDTLIQSSGVLSHTSSSSAASNQLCGDTVQNSCQLLAQLQQLSHALISGSCTSAAISSSVKETHTAAATAAAGAAAAASGGAAVIGCGGDVTAAGGISGSGGVTRQIHVIWSQSEAEQRAHQLLKSPVCGESGACEQSRRQSGVVARFHPDANCDRVTINCCRHCTGKVHVV